LNDNVIGSKTEEVKLGRYDSEISSLHYFFDPYPLRGSDRAQSLIQKQVIASASGISTPPATPTHEVIQMSFSPQDVTTVAEQQSSSSSISSFAIQHEKAETIGIMPTERLQTTSPVHNRGPSALSMRSPTVPLTEKSLAAEQQFHNLNPLSIPSRSTTVPPPEKPPSEAGSAIPSIGVHRGALDFVSKWNTDSTETIVVVPIVLSLLFAILWPAIAAGALHADAQISVWTGLTLAVYVVGIPALLIAMVAFLESKNQDLLEHS
jgi:hypothetical protein